MRASQWESQVYELHRRRLLAKSPRHRQSDDAELGELLAPSPLPLTALDLSASPPEAPSPMYYLAINGAALLILFILGGIIAGITYLVGGPAGTELGWSISPPPILLELGRLLESLM